MFERLLEYIEYTISDSWFKYAEKAEELYKANSLEYIPKLRQIFLQDLLETFVASLFIAFICASVITLIYRKKYNKKIPEEVMFKVLLHSFLITFFKTEFILFSPITFFILCLNYLLTQEIKTAIVRTEKSIIFFYILLFLCLIFYVIASLKSTQ